MGISLKVTIYLMTASMSLLSVTGNKRGPASMNCHNTLETHTAFHGGSVTINCKYPREKNIIVRHFCREDGKSQCTNLISTHTAPNTKLDRFSLKDNKEQGVYTVIISTLTNDDAGRYQCAVERENDKSTTCLTKINLEILNSDAITPTTKTCGIGEFVEIRCQYPKSHEDNEKFLCKGENPFSCKKLIHTADADSDVGQGKFVIRDNKRLKRFYVSIKNVNTADSGTYWCGSDKTWQYVEGMKTLLTVDERINTTKSNTKASRKPTDHPNPTESNTAMIGGVVGCLALLLVLVVVLLLVRHKLPRVHVCCAADGSSDHRTSAGNNTEGNNGDQNYEEIQIRNQQASSGGALSSVYATVNPSADQLHYASVNFQKDSLSVPDTNKNGSSACDRPPAAEQTLYCTVTRPGEA